MKCTNCQAVIRPVVSVDIDGTLGDFHGHFLQFAAAYLQLHPNHWRDQPYRGRESFREWFCRTTRQDSNTWHDIKLAYRQGAQKRSMPAYPGATTMMRMLRAAGAEIWICTTRPYNRLDNIDPDTRFWLAHHGIPYDGMIFDERKYWQLAEIVNPLRVMACVDDLDEQLKEANRIFGPGAGIQHANGYNVLDRWTGGRDEDLVNIANRIIRRIEIWREENEHQRTAGGISRSAGNGS